MSKINFKVKGFRMLGFPVLLLLIVGIEILSFGNQTEAASKASRAKRAYSSYYKKNLTERKYPGRYKKLYDINQDGVPEMILSYMSGVRNGYKIYTYRSESVYTYKAFAYCLKPIDEKNCLRI